MKLKYEIEHEAEHNGILYRLCKSQEDIDRCVDFYFKYFLEG